MVEELLLEVKQHKNLQLEQLGIHMNHLLELQGNHKNHQLEQLETHSCQLKKIEKDYLHE